MHLRATHAANAWNSCNKKPELRNVNSLTRSKTLEQNFTPRKARRSRQFWDLSETKLTIITFLDNKYWQLFQIRLVYTQKSNIDCANHFKIIIWSHCVFSQTFIPTSKYFYTDISVISVTFRNSVYFSSMWYVCIEYQSLWKKIPLNLPNTSAFPKNPLQLLVDKCSDLNKHAVRKNWHTSTTPTYF